MRIALPWICALISLWVSQSGASNRQIESPNTEKATITIVDITTVGEFPLVFNKLNANIPTHIYKNTKILQDP